MLVLIYLDMNQVKRIVELSGSMVFLLLPDGNYYSTEGIPPDPRWEEIGKNEEDGQEGGIVGRVPGSGEFVLSQMGETGGIRFLNVIGKKEYLKKTNQMTMVLVIYVVVCLVLGGGSAWYISRRNYQPVADLVELLPGQYQKETADNDFQKIRKAYQELVEEKSWAAEKLRDARLTGINTWLNEMLKGRSQEFYSISGREALWTKELAKKCFAVISGELLEIGKIAGGQQEAGEDTVEMAYFIVKNVLQEFLGASYASVEGTTEGILFSIVNLDEKYDQELVI